MRCFAIGVNSFSLCRRYHNKFWSICITNVLLNVDRDFLYFIFLKVGPNGGYVLIFSSFLFICIFWYSALRACKFLNLLIEIFIYASMYRVSKAVLSDYSEKIEVIASKLAAPPVSTYDLEIILSLFDELLIFCILNQLNWKMFFRFRAFWVTLVLCTI